MKKVIMLLIIVLLVAGCGQKDLVADENKVEEVFVLNKVDNDKDFIYFEDIVELKFPDQTPYKLQNLVVNIKSDTVDNINLELSSFVKNSYKEMDIYDLILSQGNVISYSYYQTDDYISILQHYYLYVDGFVGEKKDNIYVISKTTGNKVNKEELLNNFGLTENKLYEILKEKINSEDIEYTMMNIKNRGYDLYVNNDNQLVVIYYEVDDIEEIRKELIIANELF